MYESNNNQIMFAIVHQWNMMTKHISSLRDLVTKPQPLKSIVIVPICITYVYRKIEKKERRKERRRKKQKTINSEQFLFHKSTRQQQYYAMAMCNWRSTKHTRVAFLFNTLHKFTHTFEIDSIFFFFLVLSFFKSQLSFIFIYAHV